MAVVGCEQETTKPLNISTQTYSGPPTLLCQTERKRSVRHHQAQNRTSLRKTAQPQPYMKTNTWTLVKLSKCDFVANRNTTHGKFYNHFLRRGILVAIWLRRTTTLRNGLSALALRTPMLWMRFVLLLSTENSILEWDTWGWEIFANAQLRQFEIFVGRFHGKPTLHIVLRIPGIW